MGILVEDNEQRSKLQDRITADLREKSQRSSKQEDTDLVEDSAYVKNFKKTGTFGWFWFILILFAVISVIVILVI